MCTRVVSTLLESSVLVLFFFSLSKNGACGISLYTPDSCYLLLPLLLCHDDSNSPSVETQEILQDATVRPRIKSCADHPSWVHPFTSLGSLGSLALGKKHVNMQEQPQSSTGSKRNYHRLGRHRDALPRLKWKDGAFCLGLSLVAFHLVSCGVCSFVREAC